MLTEKKKADRLKMAAAIEALAVECGAVFCEREEMPDDCIRVEIQAARALRIAVEFDRHNPQPDVYVLSWNFGAFGFDRLNEATFGNVNAAHKHKATHVARGFDDLCERLREGLEMAKDGSAFLETPEPAQEPSTPVGTGLRFLDQHGGVHSGFVAGYEREDGAWRVKVGALVSDADGSTSFREVLVDRHDVVEITGRALVQNEYVTDLVRKIHSCEVDFDEGDLLNRLDRFSGYVRMELPLSMVRLGQFALADDLVDQYAQQYQQSGAGPAVVFDSIDGSMIDGSHRANALHKLGFKTIDAYIGLPQFLNPNWVPDDDESDAEQSRNHFDRPAG